MCRYIFTVCAFMQAHIRMFVWVGERVRVCIRACVCVCTPRRQMLSEIGLT